MTMMPMILVFESQTTMSLHHGVADLIVSVAAAVEVVAEAAEQQVVHVARVGIHGHHPCHGHDLHL